MSKSNTSTSEVTTPRGGVFSSHPDAEPPQDATPRPPETPKRTRASSPHVTANKPGRKKDPRVLEAEERLRDARALARLRKAADKLSAWGRGQLIEDIQRLGPVQPSLPGAVEPLKCL
jgi:hypothetical protein